MSPRIWRWGAGAALLAVVALGACRLLLPERYAVNVPLGHALFGWVNPPPPEPELAQRLRLPPGFRVGLFATDLPGPRFMRPTGAGDLLVTTPREGKVWRLRDTDGDGHADVREVLLEGLDHPHGIDLHEGWLWVAEIGAVGRVRFDEAAGATRGGFERVIPGLPTDGGHWTRTVRVGPDGWLYVSIGSSCNVCIERDPRRAAIVRYRLDGSGEEIYATGLRNAVGFDWRPEDGGLYATDNGRDFLGDDFPPCELDRVVRGGFYGWPFANGNRVPDPDFGEGHEAEIAASIPPVHEFRAHNAPLGILFLGRAEGLPAAFRGAALVALHGSWNRTRKDGYKVVSLHWDEQGRIHERDFLTGFLENEDVIGRPVDVARGRDGALYVSDDYAGAIHRVVYVGGDAPAAPAEP